MCLCINYKAKSYYTYLIFYAYPLIVVNNSLEVTIGNPDSIIVREDIKVTIDCQPVINYVRNISGSPRVVWYKNDIILTNGSEDNVYISEDNRFVIINQTSVTQKGQLGTSGNYRCCACSGDSNVDGCSCNNTTKTVCGKKSSFKNFFIKWSCYYICRYTTIGTTVW